MIFTTTNNRMMTEKSLRDSNRCNFARSWLLPDAVAQRHERTDSYLDNAQCRSAWPYRSRLSPKSDVKMQFLAQR